MPPSVVPGAAPSKQQRGKPKAAAPPTLSSKGDPQEVKVQSGGGGGRPDRDSYDREQKEIQSDIEKLQSQLSEVRSKITSGNGKGPEAERRAELRSELDSLRSDQAKIKGGRGQVFDQIKKLQEQNQARIKDLNAARQKAPFKSAADVDTQINTIEKRIESGSLKLVDEKRALQEISNLRKSRKAVERFSSKEAEIESTKAEITKLRSTLDDPESKAKSDRYTAIRAELDNIGKGIEEKQKGRDKLFEERNGLQAEIDGLYGRKRESAAAFKEANNKYYQKMQEDRNRRMERQRAEKAAFEEQKRSEHLAQMREEAEQPAYEREIEDCRTLINFFTRIQGGTPISAAGSPGDLKTVNGDEGIKGVAKLELRKVEEVVPAGATALKKKGQDEEDYFVGGKKGKKGGKKGSGATPATPAENGTPSSSSSPSSTLNLPFATLSALLQLGIAAPLTHGEIPRAIEDLSTKRRYFETNQDRVTKERIAAVEKKIRAAEAKSNKAAAPSSAPANGDAVEDAEEDEPQETNGDAAKEDGEEEEKEDAVKEDEESKTEEA